MAKLDEMNVEYTYHEYRGGHTWPLFGVKICLNFRNYCLNTVLIRSCDYLVMDPLS